MLSIHKFQEKKLEWEIISHESKTYVSTQKINIAHVIDSYYYPASYLKHDGIYTKILGKIPFADIFYDRHTAKLPVDIARKWRIKIMKQVFEHNISYNIWSRKD